MVGVIKWFDREFTFDLPRWMYPNVVERLRGTPARAEDIVRCLPPDTLTRRIADTWSIQENIGHLLDAEPLWIGRVDDIVSGKKRLRHADLSNRQTHEGRPKQLMHPSALHWSPIIPRWLTVACEAIGPGMGRWPRHKSSWSQYTTICRIQ